MTQPDAVYLRHMLDAIERVMEATERVTREDFNGEWMIQDAIVHELQILGEAAGRVPLRHKIVHDYFSVDLDVVWDTAVLDVPAIRPVVEALMSKVDG